MASRVYMIKETSLKAELGEVRRVDSKCIATCYSPEISEKRICEKYIYGDYDVIPNNNREQ